MTEQEIKARLDLDLEDYVKRVQIEGRVLSDLILNHIIPSAVNYQNELLKNVKRLKLLFPEDYSLHAKSQLELITSISNHLRILKSEMDIMVLARKKANVVDNLQNKAIMYCNSVRARFEDIRYHCDKLELIVDDKLWTIPKYRELLYTK
jgi:glutamine synthetase